LEPADWKQRIGVMALVKQKLAEVDTEGLWEHHLPRVAASEERLREVEEHLGEPLDPSLRGFLRHADGWPSFFQTVDLFGSDDFLGSDLFRHAQEMLGFLELEQPAAAGPLEGLLPIAASRVDLDLFVMTGRSVSRPGTVIWLAGSEIDRYPSFDEYFLAMIDYNRAEVANLQASNG
jgi:hypothetical protein